MAGSLCVYPEATQPLPGSLWEEVGSSLGLGQRGTWGEAGAAHRLLGDRGAEGGLGR